MSSISAAIFALCSRFEIGNGSTWPSVLTYDEVEEAERREILARGFVLLIARAAVTRRCMHGEERGGGGVPWQDRGCFAARCRRWLIHLYSEENIAVYLCFIILWVG